MSKQKYVITGLFLSTYFTELFKVLLINKSRKFITKSRETGAFKDQRFYKCILGPNPPTPELLSLYNGMCFVVAGQVFDQRKMKTKFDYSLLWNKLHNRDLED